LCCKSTRVTLITLSPHPFDSTFGGFALISIFAQTLGCLIALPLNVSQGSIIVTNNVLYPASHSSILGILDIINCTISRVWNYVKSFANYSSSTTFSSSFCCMAN
jgi:hypothetical protein